MNADFILLARRAGQLHRDLQTALKDTALVPEWLRDMFKSLVSDSAVAAGIKITGISDIEWAVLIRCDTPEQQRTLRLLYRLAHAGETVSTAGELLVLAGQLHTLLKELVGETNGTPHPDVNRYISAEVRKEVWRRDAGCCVACQSREYLEFDHIVPVSKGGSNTARNIQLLCAKCNQKKSNRIG